MILTGSRLCTAGPGELQQLLPELIHVGFMQDLERKNWILCRETKGRGKLGFAEK
jgi:hypothetical protein